LLLGHIAVGLVLVAVWPCFAPLQRLSIERWFARRLMHLVRVQVCVHFKTSQSNVRVHGPFLLLCNHVSWLDIFALNSVHPFTFIAKSEIAQWPLLGVLARRTGTLFIQRGKRHAVRHVVHAASQVLAQGRHVAVFPEGTTGLGHAPLPFHSNFVQPALAAQVPVLPVSLQYFTPALAPGQPACFSTLPAFVGDQTLWQNLKVLLTSPQGFEVHLRFHAPIVADCTLPYTRHSLCAAAHAVIAADCCR
jgi:1-acyl-sn-glycerol-3-phosphate acyltransferase